MISDYKTKLLIKFHMNQSTLEKSQPAHDGGHGRGSQESITDATVFAQAGFHPDFNLVLVIFQRWKL